MGKAKTDAELVEMHRRQLGGAEKALRRERQRVSELESLVQNLYAAYYDEWPDRAEEVYAERIQELGIEVVDE